MRVKTGLSPALALKPMCVDKTHNFVILKKNSRSTTLSEKLFFAVLKKHYNILLITQ